MNKAYDKNKKKQDEYRGRFICITKSEARRNERQETFNSAYDYYLKE